MLDMNDTGTKITTRLKVVAITASPISAVAARAASKGVMLLLFDEAEDVFQHDDGVVDHDADHQDQRQHGHAVEREIQRPHHRRKWR